VLEGTGSHYWNPRPYQNRRLLDAIAGFRGVADNAAMKPFLLADIGATNARFATATPAGLNDDVVRLRTADYAEGIDLLEAAVAALGSPRLESACLAVAGPEAGGCIRMTNLDVSFDAAQARARLDCPVTLVNDFAALSRALPRLRRLRQIGGLDATHDVKVVVGPGTGLGMGALVPLDGGWRVLASEGGHADLAPGSPLEVELLGLLQSAHGHVSWETVLCGAGLERLYRAVCALWGSEPAPLTAPQISERGVAADDPVCHQTLEIFFALLGAAAGNLALTLCARGGVYLGGGILPAMVDFAEQSPLRRRFDERGQMARVVRDVPLYVILDAEPALVGGLEFLRDAQLPPSPAARRH
jgi:glucokinase